jgi:hypothetical protein
MLKVALVAFGGFVAAVWIICGYLYFAPVDERTAPSRPASVAVAEPAGNASRQRDSPPMGPRAIGETTGVVAAAPPAVQATDTAPGMVGLEEEKRHKMSAAGEHTAARDAAVAAPPVTAQATGPQYSASGGYVLDADSVVVAPPTSADGPGSPAEQRRRTRLSVDISKIP